tara:strand:+ start:117 stop:362 length:246 start_codon:yes stop_codon:yes gene_type:complete
MGSDIGFGVNGSLSNYRMMNTMNTNEQEIYDYLLELHDEDSDLNMYMSVKIIEGVFDIGRYDAMKIVGRFMREREAAAASE